MVARADRQLSLARSTEQSLSAENHPPQARLRYLDGWRAVAIGGVLFGHFISSFGINAGRLGVELFFVLSGRLMAQILFVERMPLPYFYFRRFTRVWPGLAAFIAIVAITSGELGPIQVIGSLTFTENYLTLFVERSDYTDHIWSLCIEEHTYLFLGVVALITRRKGWRVLPILFGTVAVNVFDAWICTFVLHQDYNLVYWRTDTRMASILMGVIAFLLASRARLRLTGVAPAALGAAGVMLNMNMIPDPIKYTFGTACLALSIANLDYDTTVVKRVLASPATAWIGLISYSLYLWQQPFAVSRWYNVLPAPIALGLAVLAGVASFYLVENPVRIALNSAAPAWAQRRARRT